MLHNVFVNKKKKEKEREVNEKKIRKEKNSIVFFKASIVNLIIHLFENVYFIYTNFNKSLEKEGGMYCFNIDP